MYKVFKAGRCIGEFYYLSAAMLVMELCHAGQIFFNDVRIK